MKWNFNKILGIFSILGFIGIITRASSGNDISTWVEIFLFGIIGIALFGAGGYKLFFKYFEDGVITWDESTKILMITIGFFSMLTAFLMIPFFNFPIDNWNFFNGVKIVISIIAIFIIGLDMITNKSVCLK